MRYLIRTVETYRVDNEAAVENLIEEAKGSSLYDCTKYTREHKEKKVKGEVIDDWYKVTLTKEFTSEKEPDRSVEISYE